MTTSLPFSLSRAAMAQLFGISPQRVGQLGAMGVFRQAANGEYLFEGAVSAYADFRSRAAVNRQRPDLDRVKELQLQRLEAKLRREDAELITMAEAVEFGKKIIAKFLEVYGSLPERLEAGTALRNGLELAMPGYVAELEGQLRQCLEALESGSDMPSE